MSEVRDIIKEIAIKNSTDKYKKQLNERKEIISLGELPAQLAELKKLRKEKSSV